MRARPEVPVTDRILVPFKGDGAGADVLSWSQQDLWLSMQRRQVWIPLGSAFDLPPGTTMEDVVTRLRFMLGRYPTLRTRLRLDPDRTRQVVAGAGELPLAIADADPQADPRQAADRLALQEMDRSYDVETEWPIRMAVLRHRGVPTHLSMVLCHLAIDGAGAARMNAEMATWDPVTGKTAMPAPGLPPLEQARLQRLPAARRQSRAAMRHWENQVRFAPPQPFAHRTSGLGSDPGSELGSELGGEHRPRYWKGCLHSPATWLAARVVGARTRTETGAVLLALYAVALARMTRVSPVLVQVIVSNRFRPGFADTVSPVFQPGLCLLEVADRSIDATVAATRRRLFAAYKHAYYDPCEREELLARISHEQGQRIELGCYYNDRRRGADAAGADGPLPTPAQVRAALPYRRFDWIMAEESAFTDPLYLFIDFVGEATAATEAAEVNIARGVAPAALDLTLSADSRCLAPARIEELVNEIETLAVRAALDPTAPTGV